jgi:hypothetical protein
MKYSKNNLHKINWINKIIKINKIIRTNLNNLIICKLIKILAFKLEIKVTYKIKNKMMNKTILVNLLMLI